MEIKFNNRQELKKYLDYLECVEIEGILKNDHITNYYGRENYMDLFLDKIFNRDYIDMLSFADFGNNEKISKLLWGIWLEDGLEDLEKMIGEKVLHAEVIKNYDEVPLDEEDDSYTWTYYKISTLNHDCTLRFYGTSNGYYSEGVDIEWNGNKEEYQC